MKRYLGGTELGTVVEDGLDDFDLFIQTPHKVLTAIQEASKELVPDRWQYVEGNSLSQSFINLDLWKRAYEEALRIAESQSAYGEIESLGDQREPKRTGFWILTGNAPHPDPRKREMPEHLL